MPPQGNSLQVLELLNSLANSGSAQDAPPPETGADVDSVIRQVRELIERGPQTIDKPVAQLGGQGENIRARIADMIGGFIGGRRGNLAEQFPQGTSLERLRNRRQEDIDRFNETAQQKFQRELSGAQLGLERASGQETRRQGLEDKDRERRLAIKDRRDEELRTRRLKLQDRKEDIIAQAESVEPGLGSRISGMFDLDTPEGRGQALGMAVRRQAQLEMEAETNAAGQENMQGANLVAEEGAATLINEVVFGVNGQGGFDPASRGTESRASVQRMFRIRLEQQMAVLRGSGFSEEYVQEWARSKQARLESIMQELQAGTVNIEGGQQTQRARTRLDPTRDPAPRLGPLEKILVQHRTGGQARF